MTANANVNASGFDHAIHHPVATLVGFVSAVASKTAKGLGAMTRSMQHARMLSTLNTFSDRQLAEIGIKRSEIASYAETLMAND
jgi:uncharacterized protein YjiS (DUF1127 family)